MREQGDISSCYFTIEGTWVILVTLHYIDRTSMLSFGDCLEEPKPIPRYVLDECPNVLMNENWENLELYHIKNNAEENNY